MSDPIECLDIDAIKINYKKNEVLFDLLRGNLISCARKIKIFTVIGNQKFTETKLACEDFWGWLQIETLVPNIILSCYKLAKELKSYTLTFLKLLLPEGVINVLMDQSKLLHGIGALNKHTKKFTKVRNKRIAHIECVVVDSVSADLKILYECLASIDLSLCYIAHFLVNPHLLIESNWGAFNLQKPQDLDSLERFLECDPSIVACKKILSVGASMVP